MKPSSPTDQS